MSFFQDAKQAFHRAREDAVARHDEDQLLRIWEEEETDAQQMPDQVLFTRIAQTVYWCNKKVQSLDTAMRFRDPDLAPRVLHGGVASAVRSVGHNREFYIRPELSVQREFPDLAGGRLLLYFPDEDLACGIAKSESEGFYDVHNTPPWDTWIACFVEHEAQYRDATVYVLCYVPPHWVGLADAGIEVNPEECISWLGKRDLALARRLQAYL